MLGDSGIRKLAASLLGAALVWGPGCSEPAPSEPDAAVREAYRLSYLPAQIEAARQSIDGALQSQRAQFTDAQIAVAKRVLEEQLTPEKLETKAIERLAEGAEPGHLDATLAWLKEPRVRQVMQAGIAIETPEAISDMKGFVERKHEHPPSAKRLELIERYDRATHLSELSEETVLLSGYAVAVMADAVAPAADRLGSEALRASVDARRELLEPFFREISSVTSLFAFRDLSDDEIEALVTFSESDAGRWYFETTARAYFDILEETVAGLGPGFAGALREEPSS